MTTPSSPPSPAGSVPARIAGIATHLPDRVLDNDELAARFPEWPAAKIFGKTGIQARRIAAPGETAGDLAFAAATRLFAGGECDPRDVDFLILCTQASDYVLPTTACVLQSRLGLRREIGALDINLGCSGFVYGLSLAAGLIASGAARNVLLLTADTYSKYIHEDDRSVRTLFGDGAAATLVVPADPAGSARIGPFVFGTDGSGAGDLIVEAGGFRLPADDANAAETTDRFGNTRSRRNLYMNGGNVMAFSLREVPATSAKLLALAGLEEDEVDHFVLHQANKFMLDALQKKLGLADAKVPRHFESIGNTVSSTIPFVLENLAHRGHTPPGTRAMLIGFGVGLSWAGGMVTY